MPPDGPTAFSAAAAAGFAWAYYFSGRCCRCSLMDPLHLQQQLPLALPGTIICFERCCQCPQMGPLHLQQLLLLASPGPIISLRNAANAPGWVHCIFTSCCRWLAWAYYFSWRCSRCPWMGPLLTAAAAAGFAWAHYTSEKRC